MLLFVAETAFPGVGGVKKLQQFVFGLGYFGRLVGSPEEFAATAWETFLQFVLCKMEGNLKSVHQIFRYLAQETWFFLRRAIYALVLFTFEAAPYLFIGSVVFAATFGAGFAVVLLGRDEVHGMVVGASELAVHKLGGEVGATCVVTVEGGMVAAEVGAEAAGKVPVFAGEVTNLNISVFEHMHDTANLEHIHAVLALLVFFRLVGGVHILVAFFAFLSGNKDTIFRPLGKPLKILSLTYNIP